MQQRRGKYLRLIVKIEQWNCKLQRSSVSEQVEMYTVTQRTCSVQCNINQQVNETQYAHKTDLWVVILGPELSRRPQVLERIIIIMMIIFMVVSRLYFDSQSFENKSRCVISSLLKIPIFGLHLYSVPLLQSNSLHDSVSQLHLRVGVSMLTYIAQPHMMSGFVPFNSRY